MLVRCVCVCSFGVVPLVRGVCSFGVYVCVLVCERAEGKERERKGEKRRVEREESKRFRKEGRKAKELLKWSNRLTRLHTYIYLHIPTYMYLHETANREPNF